MKAAAIKQSFIVTKGPNVCQENISYTLTASPIQAVDTKQDESILVHAKFQPHHPNATAEIKTHQTSQ